MEAVMYTGKCKRLFMWTIEEQSPYYLMLYLPARHRHAASEAGAVHAWTAKPGATLTVSRESVTDGPRKPASAKSQHGTSATQGS